MAKDMTDNMHTSETQSQRWLKYGANVALTSAVVIALAWGVTYIAQKKPKRIDTTIAGLYSLKPQTKSVLQSVPGKVRIVSLYSNPETAGKSGTALREAEEQRQFASTVADLLQEYAKASDKVSIEFIDPGRESDKVDVLVKEVVAKYGAELKPYEDFFFKSYPEFLEKFKAFATTQSAAISNITADDIKDKEVLQSYILAAVTVQQLPANLEEAQKRIDPYLAKKPVADYRGAASTLQAEVSQLNRLVSSTISSFKALPSETSPAVKAYVTKALPEFEAAQTLVSDQLEKARSLKDLKLDSLREAIQRNTVVVMGDREMRVIGHTDLWKAPDDLAAYFNNPADKKPPLKFAGEQQVSTALLAISQTKKPLAIFVRDIGPPLTQSTRFAQARFSRVAQRLIDANFEVVEKDLSGQFAMQAQMGGGPPPPEATDEQLKDRSAIWIVFPFNFTGAQSSMMGPMGNPLTGKLKEHLAEGGSALVYTGVTRENLADALTDMGVTDRTDAVILKQVNTDLATTGKMTIVQQAESRPEIILLKRFGVHPITEPINGLLGILPEASPVFYTPGAGRSGTPLLPIKLDVNTWGETTLEGNEAPKFDAGKDLEATPDAPFYAGVAVEKTGAGRLVVFGSIQMPSDGLVTFPDEDLMTRDRRVYAPKFPANAELFVNSVFWLSKMDTMLAISPAAMEVSRVRDIPESQLQFVRWGILTIGLPGIVLIAGIAVYLTRRD